LYDAGHRLGKRMTEKPPAKNLPNIVSEKQGHFLLRLARKTIVEHFYGKAETGDEVLDGIDPILKEFRGTFVTLTIHGQLRGCIGNLEPVAPMYEAIRRNAVHAAFHDSRFAPLGVHELDQIKIDISLLSEPQPLAYRDGAELVALLRPGIDGVIVGLGRNQATFLPQVWAQLPRVEDFLDHLCLKAGLSQAAWRDGGLEVLTYQVQYISEER